MVKFNQAIKWLNEGMKVRRPSWDKDSYWGLGVDEVICWTKGSFAHVHLNQIKAEDWEIFKEEKRCPDVFIERAAFCTIEGIRAICGTDEEYSKYVEKIKNDN